MLSGRFRSKFPLLLWLILNSNPEICDGKPFRSRVLFPKDYMGKIINGNEATPGQFPWEVEIACKRKCTGSLVTSEFVLTSAHCLQDSKECHLALGHMDQNNHDGNRVIFTSKRLYPHPQFHKNVGKDAFDAGNRYDIGLIRLPTSVDITDTVHPIKFVPKDHGSMYADSNVTAIGWSKVNPGESTQVLMYATLTILSTQACGQYYPQFYRFQSMLMCAVGDKKTVFMGDSGGPLFVEDNGLPVQLAVTSYRIATTESGIPQAFIRIVPHLPWLKYVMTGMADNRTSVGADTSHYSDSMRMRSVEYVTLSHSPDSRSSIEFLGACAFCVHFFVLRHFYD